MDENAVIAESAAVRKRLVKLPCDFNDRIYSVIAEKEPHEMEIEAFQVTKDDILIVTTSGCYIKTSQIGKLYFLDKETAEYEMKRRREAVKIHEVRR